MIFNRWIVCGVVCIAAGCTKLHEVKVISVKSYDQFAQQSGLHAEFPHMVVESVETGERFKVRGEPTGNPGDTIRIRY